jgi:hypothetical protein
MALREYGVPCLVGKIKSYLVLFSEKSLVVKIINLGVTEAKDCNEIFEIRLMDKCQAERWYFT